MELGFFQKLASMDFETISIVFGASIAVIYGFIELITHKKAKTEYLTQFSNTVSQLSSDNNESRLSAAILLRRYLKIKFGFKKKFLFDETVNVIASLLKILPTGIYQKTLGDGLAYAGDLSDIDLQKTNLQNLYLGNKKNSISLQRTDLFMADLSYALLENIQGRDAILYKSILFNTQIKNSNFENANFCGADLKNARFKNVRLKGADFTDAVNLPEEISKHLENGKYVDPAPVSVSVKTKDRYIFFSMPGVMMKNDELIVKELENILIKKGFEVFYYYPDNYPEYGQLSCVKEKIVRCAGIVAFGFKQMKLVNGMHRPETKDEKIISNEWLSTPWNEIEVGMALMIGLPVLLVHDDGIKYGIFDPCLSEHYIKSLNSSMDLRNIENNETFNIWLKELDVKKNNE